MLNMCWNNLKKYNIALFFEFATTAKHELLRVLSQKTA